MPTTSEIAGQFATLGGAFITAADELVRRLDGIRGFVFDWDGVFNAGAKGEGATSTFSETDSMGLNLLRYALWRKHGELPVAAVISGADNPSAQKFAEREHWNAVCCGALDKVAALDHVCQRFDIESGALLCVFDDVNDLGMAARCAIRVLVRRHASPLLAAYVVEQGLCDYVTGLTAGEGALRETAELLLGLMGQFAETARSRVAWDRDYARYFEVRQAVETKRFSVPLG